MGSNSVKDFMFNVFIRALNFLASAAVVKVQEIVSTDAVALAVNTLVSVVVHPVISSDTFLAEAFSLSEALLLDIIFALLESTFSFPVVSVISVPCTLSM